MLEKAEDLLKEREAWLLEQHEVSGIWNKYTLFYRRMHQVAHQALAVLRERPGIEGARDHERGDINVGRVPE